MCAQFQVLYAPLAVLCAQFDVYEAPNKVFAAQFTARDSQFEVFVAHFVKLGTPHGKLGFNFPARDGDFFD